MIKTFTTQPHNLINKIEQLINEGWKILMTQDTSTLHTPPDAHGVSYGGSEVSILCKKEKDYQKPQVLNRIRPNGPFGLSRPCNPPKPGGR